MGNAENKEQIRAEGKQKGAERKRAEEAEKWLSIEDLAKRFSMSYSCARRLMENLPCVDLAPEGRKNRMLRVSPWAVEQFLKQRKMDRRR